MSKKNKTKKVMLLQEAEHTAYTIIRLADAMSTLNAMERLCNKCANDKIIEEALLHNVIALYGSVFKGSDVGGGKKHKVEKSCVPEEYLELHNRLICYRDKLVAHFDHNFRKPTRGKAKNGSPFYKLAKSPVPDMKNEIAQIK